MRVGFQHLAGGPVRGCICRHECGLVLCQSGAAATHLSWGAQSRPCTAPVMGACSAPHAGAHHLWGNLRPH